MAAPNPVPKLYRSVVDDVITSAREFFLDEGADEQVLTELKQLWESKLTQTKAVEGPPTEQDRLLMQTSMPQAAAAQNTQPMVQVQQQQHAQLQPAQIPMFNPTTGVVQLSSPAQAAAQALPQGLYQQQLAALQQSGQLAALQQGGIITLTQHGGAQYVLQQAAPPPGQQQQQHSGQQQHSAVQPGTTFTLPPGMFTQVQQPTTTQQQGGSQPVLQLDGAQDSSSDDDDEYDNADDDDDNDDDHNEEENDEQGEEEEPLNSADDISDEDPSELFDIDNVVVCQYDKINRNKNRWKFHLKDGIMNLNGKDYVFQKAQGDAEW